MKDVIYRGVSRSCFRASSLLSVEGLCRPAVGTMIALVISAFQIFWERFQWMIFKKVPHWLKHLGSTVSSLLPLCFTGELKIVELVASTDRQ